MNDMSALGKQEPVGICPGSRGYAKKVLVVYLENGAVGVFVQNNAYREVVLRKNKIVLPVLDLLIVAMLLSQR